MSKQLERLSKDLASGVSRRQAFLRFGGGFGLALLSFLTKPAKAQGNSVCVAFCRARWDGSDFGHCVAASTHCPPNQCAVLRDDSWVCSRLGSKPPV
jgi:hypothetical protein